MPKMPTVEQKKTQYPDDWRPASFTLRDDAGNSDNSRLELALHYGFETKDDADPVTGLPSFDLIETRLLPAFTFKELRDKLIEIAGKDSDKAAQIQAHIDDLIATRKFLIEKIQSSVNFWLDIGLIKLPTDIKREV